MWTHVKTAILSVLVLTVLTGVIYPLVVTGLALVFFPGRAGGSLVERDGEVVGSELIGQPFSSPGYFWGRPSATGPAYNGGASAGANLGPTNPTLHERVGVAAGALRASHGDSAAIPVDLATASASGLDPHLSPAAAIYQVARVASARGLSKDAVQRLVDEHTEGRQLGFFGEPRVNVLLLNLALDELVSPSVEPAGRATAITTSSEG